MQRTGKIIEPGGRVYNSLNGLSYDAGDYILPKGGTQSSQFEESINEDWDDYIDKWGVFVTRDNDSPHKQDFELSFDTEEEAIKASDKISGDDVVSVTVKKIKESVNETITKEMWEEDWDLNIPAGEKFDKNSQSRIDALIRLGVKPEKAEDWSMHNWDTLPGSVMKLLQEVYSEKQRKSHCPKRIY